MKEHASPPPPTSRPVVVCLAEVDPEPIRWLWPSRIPLGKLTLLVGDAAVGKTLVALDIAARVSAGTPWPDSTQATNSPGGVLLLCAEDDLADTVQPRLAAAGADLNRITALTSLVRTSLDPLPLPLCRASLQPTLDHLETAIQQTPNCRLLLIDPVTRLLNQIHSPSETTIARAVMEPLADLAARCRIAVLAVHQARRTATGFAWQKTTPGFATAAARSVWALVHDNRNGSPTSVVPQPNDAGRPDDKTPNTQPSTQDEETEHRLLLPIKSTVAHNARPLACSIRHRPDQTAPFIAWQAMPVDVATDEILDTRASNRDQSLARAWLQEVLSEGPAPATEIIRQAKHNGFGERLIRQAFAALGCLRIRKGSSLHSLWIWALPGDTEPLAQYELDPFTEVLHEQDAQLQTLLSTITSPS